MTWFVGVGVGVVSAVVAVGVAFVVLHVWATSGRRRQTLAQLRAEERLRELQLEGLHRLVEVGERSLASTRLGFTDADIEVFTKPERASSPIDLHRSSWQHVQHREQS